MLRARLFDESARRENFLSSSYTLKELASRYNASFSLVSKLANRENWTEEREKYRKTSARVHFDIIQSESSAKQHVDRSIDTGKHLHQLIREATESVKVGDIRALKTLVDAWSSWDNQMRKTHRLNEEKSESPINIQLLASLPDEPKYIHSECAKFAEPPDK